MKFRKGQYVYIKRNYGKKNMDWSIGKTSIIVQISINPHYPYTYGVQNPIFKKYAITDIIYTKESELRKATRKERELFKQHLVEEEI